jgi:hypothetical protein
LSTPPSEREEVPPLDEFMKSQLIAETGDYQVLYSSAVAPLAPARPHSDPDRRGPAPGPRMIVAHYAGEYGASDDRILSVRPSR